MSWLGRMDRPPCSCHRVRERGVLGRGVAVAGHNVLLGRISQVRTQLRNLSNDRSVAKNEGPYRRGHLNPAHRPVRLPTPGLSLCLDRRAEVRWTSAFCMSAARRWPTADGLLVTGWGPPGSWLESGVGSRLARCEFGESSGLVGLHRLRIPANHVIADDDHWATLPSRGFEKRRPVGITLDIDLGVRKAASVKEPLHPGADLRRLCRVYRDLRHAPPRSIALPPRV